MKKNPDLWLGNEAFKAWFENDSSGVVIADKEKNGVRILDANPAFCTMLEYSREELRIMDIRNIAHSEEFEEREEILNQLAADSIPFYKGEKRYITRSKKTVLTSVLMFKRTFSKEQKEYFIAVVDNISKRSRFESMIQSIIISSSSFGQSFFELLLEQFAKIIQSDTSFIAEIADKSTTRLRTLAHFTNGKIADNFEYDIKGGPCEHVLGEKSCSYSSGLSTLFPANAVFAPYEGYAGIPLVDQNGQTLGIIVALFVDKLKDPKFVESIMEIFASRVSVELVRVHTQNQLLHAKQYAENLIRTANVMFVSLDVNGRITGVNEKTENVTKYSEEELIGKNWFETLVPKIRYPEVWEKFLRLHNGEIPRVFENSILTKDGSERFISWSNSKLIHDGNVVGTFSFGIDITDKKEMIETLHANKEQYRILVDTIPHGIQENDLRGTITYSSNNHAKLFGYLPGELVGKKIWDLLCTDGEKTKFRSYFERLISDQPHPQPFIGKNKTKDGRTVDVHVDWTYKRDDAGTLIGFISIISDITEIRKIQKERDRLFDFSLDMLCIAGFDGYFKQVNPAWEKTLGWTAHELLSQPYVQFVHPEDYEKTIAIADTLMRGEGIYQFENRYRNKQGEYRWLSWNSFPLPEEGLIFAVARDITVRKQTELALVQSQKGLEHKNIALREIVAQIEVEKNQIKEQITTNITKVVQPLLKKLILHGASEKYIHLIEKHLMQLTSSFGLKITDKTLSLTPKEVELCNILKGGLSNKEIADLLSISLQTVEKHRKNIRKKLGISNKEINLVTYLQSL